MLESGGQGDGVHSSVSFKCFIQSVTGESFSIDVLQTYVDQGSDPKRLI